MKAFAYGALSLIAAASSLEATADPVRNLCTLLAAVTFGAFIGNVGRRPVR